VSLVASVAIWLVTNGCENMSPRVEMPNHISPIRNYAARVVPSLDEDGGESSVNDGKSITGPIVGTVRDSLAQTPLSNVLVVHAGKSFRTDTQGRFQIGDIVRGEPLILKASGYFPYSISDCREKTIEVRLEPHRAMGLYLTHFGIGNRVLRDRALNMIRATGLNSLVIDVKGDRGYLSYKFNVPLAAQIGAHGLPTIKDIHSLLQQLHQEKIYVIARIVVFKDNILAQAKPEWAILNTQTEKPWIDNEELAWVDPFRQEVWDYNIAIAREAARAGFDEVQFDYVRFPTGGKLSATRYSKPNTRENRIQAISCFLEKTARELRETRAFLSADVFGYVPWNKNDTDIGQSLPELAQHLDYICLMVYPSGYHLGIPGFRNPLSHPREVVYYTLEQAKKRLGGQAEKLRPWIQNFPDYAFDKRPFTGNEISAQMMACDQAGTSGWLLWDPSNKYNYTLDALRLREKGGEASPLLVRAEAGRFQINQTQPEKDNSSKSLNR